MSDGALGEADDASGAVHLGDAKLVVRAGRQAGNATSAITQFSVRRYPLDKSRYEVMLELTNTGPDAEDVELQLLGDGALVDLTKLRLQPGERLPRFYPQLSGASRTLEAKIARADGTHDDLPADDHAYALLPERRRAKVLVVTRGQHVPRGRAAPRRVPRRDRRRARRATRRRSRRAAGTPCIFDGVTPAEPPRASALYLDPRGPGLAGQGRRASSKPPGFDKIDRKHPAVRFLALDDVNIAAGHKLVPQSGRQGPRRRPTAARRRSSSRAPAAASSSSRSGFDVRDSDLPLRIAWPLFVLDCINWFTDEDAQYLSSLPHRRGVAHPRAAARPRRALVKLPDGTTQPVPVHEGRAVLLGEHAGFYELTDDAATRSAAGRLRREPARRRGERHRPAGPRSRSTEETRASSRASTSACAARSGSTCSSRPRS